MLTMLEESHPQGVTARLMGTGRSSDMPAPTPHHRRAVPITAFVSDRMNNDFSNGSGEVHAVGKDGAALCTYRGELQVEESRPGFEDWDPADTPDQRKCRDCESASNRLSGYTGVVSCARDDKYLRVEYPLERVARDFLNRRFPEMVAEGVVYETWVPDSEGGLFCSRSTPAASDLS